jgi:hypothetical protein
MICSSQEKNPTQLASSSDSKKQKTKENAIFLCGILNLEIRILIQNVLELLDPAPVYV